MSDEPDTLAPETGNPAVEEKTTEKPADKGADQALSGDTPPSDVKPDWPDDWRDKMAGGDEKLRKRLDRFQSPVDIQKSWAAAEQKISSGEFKAPLPDDATEDQVAAFRKENGIPDKPEAYLDNLPDGLVIGEADKDLVGSFLERAHGKNADPGVVADMIDWYYGQQEGLIAQGAEADKERARAGEDALRAEWGSEYRGNLNAMENFLAQAPADDEGNTMRDLLLSGRLSDGTMVKDSPLAVKWLTSLANDANPAGFIAPGSGLSQADSVDAEIKEIEGTMRTNRSAYNKDEKMQARYLQLLEAKEKLSSKA